jgi:hypothetical protein
MRLIGILFLSLLFSCNSPKEHREKSIPDPSLENPWTYINRISDTLPETEFSLYNSKNDNLRIFKENETEKMFRYRIAQGKQMPVIAFNFDPDGMAICYVMSNFFDVEIKENGDFFMHDYSGNIFNFQLDSLFYKFLIDKIGTTSPRYPRGLFSIKFRKFVNQKVIVSIIDKLANGYFLYLNWYSNENFKLNFIELTRSEQNKILNSIPFALDYNIHRLYPKPPQIPLKFKNQ